jgi:hypothetical protein
MSTVVAALVTGVVNTYQVCIRKTLFESENNEVPGILLLDQEVDAHQHLSGLDVQQVR